MRISIKKLQFGTMGNRLVFMQRFWPIILILTIGLVTITWFRGDYLILYHDEVFPIVPEIEFRRYLYTWFEMGLGYPNGALPKIIPFFIIYVLSKLGLSLVIIEKLLYYFLFSFSGISMYLLASYLFRREEENLHILSLSASLFYMFNVFTLFYVFRLNYIITREWFVAFYPLALMFFLKIVESDKPLFRNFIGYAISLLLVVPSFTHPAFFIMFWIPPLLFVLLKTGTLFIKKEVSKIRNIIIRFGVLVIITIMLNSFWILPQIFIAPKLFSLTGSPKCFKYVLEYNSKHASILNVIRFKGLPPLYEGNIWYRWEYMYRDYLPFDLISIIIPMIAAIPLLSRKRKSFNVLFLYILWFLSIFFTKGIHEPFGEAYYMFFANINLFKVFRDPFKFGFLLIVPYSLLFGLGVRDICNRISKFSGILSKFVVLSLLFSTVVIYPWPMWTEDCIPQKLYHPSARVSIPESYAIVADVINSMQGEFRVLIVPIFKGKEVYNWEQGAYVTWTGGILGRMIKYPSFSKISQFTFLNLSGLTPRKIIFGKILSKEFLYGYGIKVIVVDESIDPNFSYGKISPKEYEEYITNNLKEYALLGAFKNLKVYIYNEPNLQGYNSISIIPDVNKTCLHFDGKDDYVVVPHSNVFNANKLTITLWFKANPGYGSGANSGLIAKRSSTTGSWGLWIRTSDGKIWGRVWQSDGTRVNLPATFTIKPDTWYFVAFIADGSEVKLFVNGEQISSVEYDGTILPTTYNITIGKQGLEYFNGEIAYMFIYNRALSNEEIQKLYLRPDNPPLKGLVLWFNSKCIDTESNLWCDLSGNENHGIICGATPIICKVWDFPLFLSMANNALNYTKINPTLWEVQVNVTKPFMLSFAESYDPLWEARVYKGGKLVEKVRSIPLYSVINGFWINSTGNLTIVIRYVPQDWFELGLKISATTFALCIFCLVWDWRRGRGDRWVPWVEGKFRDVFRSLKKVT